MKAAWISAFAFLFSISVQIGFILELMPDRSQIETFNTQWRIARHSVFTFSKRVAIVWLIEWHFRLCQLDADLFALSNTKCACLCSFFPFRYPFFAFLTWPPGNCLCASPFLFCPMAGLSILPPNKTTAFHLVHQWANLLLIRVILSTSRNNDTQN